MTDIAIVMLDRYTEKYLEGLWADYVQDTIQKSTNESIEFLQNRWAESVAESVKSKKLSLINKPQKSFNFFV